MGRRKSYKFTEKSQSVKGIVSFGIAVVSVILYLIYVFLSFKQAGNLSVYYGSMGVIAMIVSLVALIASILSLKEEDTFKLFSRLGIGISLIAVLLWGGTYVMGFMM